MTTRTKKSVDVIVSANDEHDQPFESTLEYKYVVWSMILKHGGVVKLPDRYQTTYYIRYIDSYAGSLHYNKKQSKALLASAQSSGINLSKSTDPAQHIEDCFNGTFASEQLHVEFLIGTLVTGDGEEYLVGAMTNEITDPGINQYSGSFGALVQALTARPKVTMKAAVDSLEHKLEHSSWYFS